MDVPFLGRRRTCMLKFNGVEMPEPQALTTDREKIWSSNTGRSDSGRMNGDIVAIKAKIKIQWGILSAEQTALIDSYLSQSFFECTYLDPTSANKEVTKEVYAGTPTYPVYSYVEGLPEYKGVGVDLIER